MEIKKTTKTEVSFTLEDLKGILCDKAKLNHGNSKIEQVYKTEMIPGGDPHDADYVQVLVGFKLICEE